MRPVSLATSFAVLFCTMPAASADELGGGAAASHGRVPRLVLDRWIPGSASAFRFVDMPTGSGVGIAMLSTNSTNMPFPPYGTLVADMFRPGSLFLAVAGQLPLTIPRELAGASIVFQGLALDPASPGGAVFTDATLADFFAPRAIVGNQRQTANSLSVIDLPTHAVVDRLGNSENGYITFSPDRTRAYVCEPGSQRNRVVVYDLRVSPIVVQTTVTVSGGIRYGAAITRDGKRLYVPLHNGVAIVDSDPSSATFHTEIGRFSTLITGNSGTIFTGPLDLAVTPDGRKLYIAYGENKTWPATSSVGVVDLTNTTYPERLITVTTGGTFFDLATRPRIKISQDGNWVFTVEYGVDPSLGGGGFVKGFANGAVVNVINTTADIEVAVIPTNGFEQSELAVDRMGRNVWVAQYTLARLGEVLRIDVDRRSATRFTGLQHIPVDPTPYAVGAGPKGIDVTPDGATVVVSVIEDGAHAVPIAITLDALTNAIVGSPITVESLCATVSVQQR